MNKVITINLNGVAFQVDEGGFEALRLYLDHAARRLEGNPDQQEILSDIEQSIADKFRNLLGPYKTVVNTKEVTGVLAEMGPVEDDSTGNAAAETAAGRDRAEKPSEDAGAAGAGASANRRLYRITDGAMIAGVCNGLAAYVNLDATIIRLLFALLTLFWGTGALVYLVMAIIVPEAKTPAEKAAATGVAATAQEFINRAREGYYEGMKSFRDKQARRAWRNQFKQEARRWRHGFHRQMADRPPAWTGPGAAPSVIGPVVIAPLLSLLLFAGAIGLVYTIYKLVTTQAAFGVRLPSDVPLWFGILTLAVAYHLLTWPIKVLRYSCYHPGIPVRPWAPLGSLLGGLFGLFFAAFGIWMLDRHVPEFHEWLVQLPSLLHRLADAVQEWWAKKG